MANIKRTIYVGGLAEDVDVALLQSSFSTFGDIIEVNLPLDYTSQKHRGFAFIEFQLPEDAADAIDNMDGGEILGRTIKVNLSKQLRPKESGNRPVWADEEYLQSLKASESEVATNEEPSQAIAESDKG